MAISPWAVMIDIGIVSVLLLLGKVLRARVKFIQRLFLPPSMIAGLSALVLGPGVLGWLPLSSNMGSYAAILIALVFSTLPLTSSSTSSHSSPKGESRVGRMWAYSQAGMLLQWALGGLMGCLVLSVLWNTDPSAGLAMPAGFCGGHGTAAAIGDSFDKYGITDMRTLAMTAATVGILASVIIGMALVSFGSARGYTRYLPKFSELPPELRSGLLPREKRQSMGEAAFSAISLDSMTFNFALIAVITLMGYGISKGIEAIWPQLLLPVFSCAFISGIGVSWLLRRCKVDTYVSKPIVGHLGGAFTDYLVAFGVASIKLEIVVKYLVPLLVLLSAGLLLTALYVFCIGRRIHRESWFEKSIFTWGWFTGTMAMGLALLRITDPDSRSGCLDDYALAYLYIAPVEIALVTFSPLFFVRGQALLFSLSCLGAGLLILGFSVSRGWLRGGKAGTESEK